MDISKNKLSLALSSSLNLEQVSCSDWDLIIRQARASNLLCKLYFLLKQRGVVDRLPMEVSRHLQASQFLGANLCRSVFREVDYINAALKSIDLPVVLLKGAAYVVRGAEAGNGRLFSDIDILVEKKHLEKAEESLKHHGWFNNDYDEYNEKYYRTWMHEIPALTHIKRDSVLDVHHAITPPTSNIKSNTGKLICNLESIEGMENVFTLSSVDLILHSAVHLFQDGEFDHGFRDLVDLDSLIREFSEQDEIFWERLTNRSVELGFQRPIYYAIKYAKLFLNTPIPHAWLQRIEKGRPTFPTLMDFFFGRALMPAHSTCDDRFTSFARWALYIRAHYLRMPLYLLIPHLIRKAYMKRMEKNKTAAE